MELGNLDYLAVFAVTLALTLGLTPLALRFAIRRQILDHPSLIKAQEIPIPYLGGIAIVLSFAAVVLGAAILVPPASGLGELATILGLAVLLAIVGLVDDLRGLSPWLRLAIEIGAALAIWATPAGAQLFQNSILDLIVTVVWIVGITNALNLLDNMDGLSAGVGAIAAATMFVVAAQNEQFLVATLSIALCGCAIGFLRSNFHPARIYMGDAGALFLGFMLAVLGLKLQLKDAPMEIGFAVPMLALGIALFDTALVTINRIRHKVSPFSGGRDHTSHRLVFIGIPVRATVSIIYFAAATFGVLAVVVSRGDRPTGLILCGWVLAVVIGSGVLLSSVPVYETSRRRHLMLQEVAKHDLDEPSVVEEEAS